MPTSFACGSTVPAPHDGVLRGLVAQVGSGGGDLGDGDRHRRVVGPLAGLPAAATHHGDLELGPAGGLELIRRAECVAGGRAQQDPLDAVIS